MKESIVSILRESADLKLRFAKVTAVRAVSNVTWFVELIRQNHLVSDADQIREFDGQIKFTSCQTITRGCHSDRV